jgi:hypothetical protein
MFFRSMIDDSRSMINNCNEMHQIVASLTDDSRVVIYNQDISIVQVTGLMCASKAGAYPSENTIQVFHFRVNSCLTHKHYTRLEGTARYKHSSLL